MIVHWRKALLIVLVTGMILTTVTGCKKSSAQRQSQRSSTTQKQAEKAVGEDL